MNREEFQPSRTLSIGFQSTVIYFPNDSVWEEIPFHLDKFSIPVCGTFKQKIGAYVNSERHFSSYISSPKNMAKPLTPSSPRRAWLLSGSHCGNKTHLEEAKQKGGQCSSEEASFGFFCYKRGHGSKVSKASPGSNVPWLSNNSSSTEIIFQILFRVREIWNKISKFSMSKKLCQNVCIGEILSFLENKT